MLKFEWDDKKILLIESSLQEKQIVKKAKSTLKNYETTIRFFKR